MDAVIYLAHEIEWLHAIDRARANWPSRAGPRKGRRWKDAIASEFDPHAATELAGLIERRLFPEASEAYALLSKGQDHG